MHQIRINGKGLLSWDAFHNYFSRVFGFPDFYGRNMDAWIDCMNDLDHPEHEMTKNISLKEGESIELIIYNAEALKIRNKKIYETLIDCSSFINQNRIKNGGTTLIHLSFKE